MRSFKITVCGDEYLVKEKNRRSGLYELFKVRDSSVHTIGRSKTEETWLYISKSPFSELSCFKEITDVLETYFCPVCKKASGFSQMNGK